MRAEVGGASCLVGELRIDMLRSGAGAADALIQSDVHLLSAIHDQNEQLAERVAMCRFVVSIFSSQTEAEVVSILITVVTRRDLRDLWPPQGYISATITYQWQVFMSTGFLLNDTSAVSVPLIIAH